jgi:hypothetical protein
LLIDRLKAKKDAAARFPSEAVLHAPPAQDYEHHMPFSDKAINPNHIEFMRAGFNRVCERLGSQCCREDRIAADLVADAIVEIAGNGEQDLDRLVELVLTRLKELPT